MITEEKLVETLEKLAKDQKQDSATRKKAREAIKTTQKKLKKDN